MIFQRMKHQVIISGICFFSASVLLGASIPLKNVPIGVRVRIAPVVLLNWNCSTTEREEILKDMEKEFMEAVCREFKHWNFKSIAEAHSKYILTFDVWESTDGKISLLAWMDDSLPCSQAVDERMDKILVAKEWLDPGDLHAGLPNKERTLKECRDFIEQAFPVGDDKRKITIQDKNLRNVFPLAWDPKKYGDEGGKFVLPLSKEYEELSKSFFRFLPYAGNPERESIVVEGKGVWEKYSDEMEEALLTEVQDGSHLVDSVDDQLFLIYLLEQRPVTNGGLFWDTEVN